MKKVVIILIAAALVLGLAACGSSRRAEVDEMVYEYAEALYELVRDYNLGKVTNKDAQDRLERIRKNLDAITISDKDPSVQERKEITKSSVEIDALTFSTKLLSGDETATLEKDLKDFLNKYK